MSLNFLALDFETSDYRSDSACSVGLVRVENSRVVARESFLIRPPRNQVMFTEIHGITWDDVEDQPTFGELWPKMAPFFKDIDFVAAHNAGFDRRILKGCCEAYGVDAPEARFVCTVKLARKAWDLFPTKLPNVCDYLGIELDHHQALSDADACANIVLAASKTGVTI